VVISHFPFSTQKEKATPSTGPSTLDGETVDGIYEKFISSVCATRIHGMTYEPNDAPGTHTLSLLAGHCPLGGRRKKNRTEKGIGNMSNALANKYIRRRPLIRSDFLHCKKSHCLNFGNCWFSKVVRGFLNRIFGAASLVTFSML